MEYAKPLIELAHSTGQELNEAVQASIVLWNLAIAREEKNSDLKLEKDIAKSLSQSFKMDQEEVNRFMEMMVERKSHLFPPEVQPKDKFLPFMFIRKEVRHLIRPFDFNKLKISDKKFGPDAKDLELIDRLRKLDQLIETESDWEEVEKPLHHVKDVAEDRFRNWLILKEISEEADRFSNCLHIFLDFVYGYMHDDVVVLRSVGWRYWKEFFEDYLVRKVMVDEPHEYVDWSPALKLFYTFLHEKGYLEDPIPLVSLIDRIEPDFINVLRKQFS